MKNSTGVLVYLLFGVCFYIFLANSDFMRDPAEKKLSDMVESEASVLIDLQFELIEAIQEGDSIKRAAIEAELNQKTPKYMADSRAYLELIRKKCAKFEKSQ